MAEVQIEEYSLAYQPAKGGAYRIRVKGTPEWSPWFQVPAADLAAIAAILNEDPVYYDPQTGIISTHAEPTGT